MASKSVINVRILGDNKGLKGALDESESKLSEFAKSAGKVVAGAATAAGAAVAAALGKGFLDATSAAAGEDLIQAGLGIDEETAGRIGDAASGAYRDAWGDNLAEVQETAAGIFQAFGDDIDLEGLTGQAEALGDAFRIDVGQGVQTAQELVSSGLATSADEAFDLLTVGLQKMPAGIRDELLAASNEYGDFFGDLGFSGKQTFGLLTEFAQQGQYGIDKAGDAIKEFTISATDGSATSAAAFEAAGLSFEDIGDRVLAGGETASEAFAEVVSGLLRIEDPSEQASAALALFKAPLEDLSVSEIPSFLSSLEMMGGNMGDVEGAAADLADTVGGNTKTKIEAFRRQALGKLADFTEKNVIPLLEQFGEYLQRELPPIIDRVRSFFEANWPKIQATIQSVVGWFVNDALPVLQSAATTVIDALRPVGDVIRRAFEFFDNNRGALIGAITGIGVAISAALLPPLIASAAAAVAAAAPFIALGAAAAAIGAGVVYAYQNFEPFREVVDATFAFLRDTALPIVQDFARSIIDAFAEVVAFVQRHWGTIEEVITTAIDVVSTVIDAAVTTITKLWETFGDDLVEFVVEAWDAISDYIDAAIRTVQGIIDTVTSLIKGDWDGVWNGIKDTLQGVWDGIESIIDLALSAIDLAIDGTLSAISAVWSEIWDGIKGVTSDVWDDIKSTIGGAIDGIVGFVVDLPGRITSAVAGAFGAIYDEFASGINRVIRAWNNLSFTLGGGSYDPLGKFGPSITVPSFTISTPNIPQLHSGGVVPGPDGSEVLALLQAGEYVTSRRNVERGDYGPRREFPDKLTLIIEGRPFTAMLAERDRDLVGAIRAGAR